jgi:cell division septation protein DedD
MPMDDMDGSSGPGDAAAQRPRVTARAAPIRRVTAPTEGATISGRWQLFAAELGPWANLAPSANWAPSIERSREPDDGRTPQSAPTPLRTPDFAAGASAEGGRYSVQAGAFRDSANASAQAARLSAAGYTPRIIHAKATQSRLYMVRLGAFPDRPSARAFARRIAARVGVDTWPVGN